MLSCFSLAKSAEHDEFVVRDVCAKGARSIR